MAESPNAARLAEVAKWCRNHAKELGEDILDNPIAKLPHPTYGAVCRQALAYAIDLGAARLIPELGATEIDGKASMAEALQQVQLLAEWVASAETADAQAKTESKSDYQPRQLPPEGTRIEEQYVPYEYREGGKPDGAVLTTPYLARSTNWLLNGPYLTKHFGPQPDRELKHRIKVGSAFAYCYVELLILRDRRDANAEQREQDE